MSKEKNEGRSTNLQRLADYGKQILVVFIPASIFFGLPSWFFGFSWNLFWINVIFLAIWFISVLFSYAIEAFWKNYRWIIGSAVLILLVLINSSWAKSNLGIYSLEKRQFVQYPIPDSNADLLIEYPSQILYDSQTTPSLILWVNTPAPFTSPTVIITADDLLLGFQTLKDSPVQWEEIVQKSLPTNGDALTVLLLPTSLNPDTTKEITLFFEIITAKKSQIKELTIKMEGGQNAQHRMWVNAFLDTGGIIVSLVLGVFAALKQLDDEKKRQKAERIKQSLTSFEADVKSDFSNMLEEHLALTADWNEWDKALQEQFRKAYSSLAEEKLWGALVAKTTTEIIGDVDLYIQVCERIFVNKEEKPISTLKQLQSALQQGEQAPLALLTVLREHPGSISTAKIIASAFPPDLKRKTIDDYTGKFAVQIRDLRVELDFPDFESFPLQGQFSFYTKSYASEGQLIAWLKAHELDCSPFADADNPFYSVLTGRLLIDMDMAPPGFIFPTHDLQNRILEFANSWDAGAGLFEYCNALKSNVSLKDDIFFAIITPSMVENYGTDHARKLYLHALAEQWIWSLAETPTLFYSLQGEQRDLAGRLIRWHDLSPSITVHKIGKFVGRLQEEEKKKQTLLLSGITEWLSNKDATDLRAEEVNALIELQPDPKHNSLFLISTIDLNPHVEKQMSRDLHEKLAMQSDWLSAHNSRVINFSIGTKDRQVVTLSSLVNQCKARTRKCSNDKLEFNQLFDAPGEEPDVILAQKANGSPGRMVRLGQKLLLQHVEKYPPNDEDYKYLHIEDLEAL